MKDMILSLVNRRTEQKCAIFQEQTVTDIIKTVRNLRMSQDVRFGDLIIKLNQHVIPNCMPLSNEYISLLMKI